MSDIKSLGQVAFEAYRAEVQGVAYDGSGIPPWDSLDGDRTKAQRGWEAAAQAVRQHVQLLNALDRTKHLMAMRAPSRWQPLSDYTGPEGRVEVLPEPEFSAPIGRGEPPTGETVPVDVEPVKCDDPRCTRREADH